MIELTKGLNTVTLFPELGGAMGVWKFDGEDVFLPVGNPDLKAQKGEAVGAYPLVPYSNRIANGRFEVDGQTYQLDKNMGEHPHTIHGNAWELPWTVAHKTDSHAVLVLEHRPNVEARADERQWPFAYRAALIYQLHNDGLAVEMVVENLDTVEQPVGFGFHPFLAAQGPATLRFDADAAWVTDENGLPVRQEKTQNEWSFTQPVDAHARFIDNCFSGFKGEAELVRPDVGLTIRIEADPVFGHVVVFTAPDGPFVAVEPVTNMTDAINHPEIAGRGLHVLKPAGRVGGTMRFRVKRSG
ncbi:aldose 1-epimerase [Neokomagataea thailandica NBRC 106555]|uniref:Aldose 1-epimerase n=2 Tax=Neokomagataea TaxID=1223423 RepID=A0A4Y6V904_9PROT|nr:MULTISPECIES: aldose 1-epimerase [Neokomagataea]QDH25140.1 aldose 1-epimerase [Neokomagataea tanensis]GBR52040.1 aldose 1-epimerase [Neokomagataea thailandica NBRC 106555]